MTDPGNLREDPLSDISNDNPTTPIDSQTLMSQYNTRSPAVKRIMREASEMARNEDGSIHAQPLQDNLFEWHFTFRGPPDTVYSRGIYHGRVILPSQYPMSPPEIVMLTPSGRFDQGTKICLSISNFHPETWQPSWSIRTAIVALRTFMSTDSPGSIGSVECSESVRSSLASTSHQYNCVECGLTGNILPPEEPFTSIPPPPAASSQESVPKPAGGPTPSEENLLNMKPQKKGHVGAFTVTQSIKNSTPEQIAYVGHGEEVTGVDENMPPNMMNVIDGVNLHEFEVVGFPDNPIHQRRRTEPQSPRRQQNEQHPRQRRSWLFAVGFVLSVIAAIICRRIVHFFRP